MRIFKSVLFGVLCSFIVSCFPAKAMSDSTQGIDVEARSAILMEVETGKIIFDKNSKEKFAPASGGAGAKTATAQTGKYEDGVEKVISWVAGYYPQEEPRYVITVMGEDGTGGGATCGPVFKEIADALPLE